MSPFLGQGTESNRDTVLFSFPKNFTGRFGRHGSPMVCWAGGMTVFLSGGKTVQVLVLFTDSYPSSTESSIQTSPNQCADVSNTRFREPMVLSDH